MKLIKCVPNISEGRDKKVLEILKNSLIDIKNCSLLNFESDYDYNRTVVTFIGDEEGVLNGALSLSRAAAGNIDMRNHSGEHPRIGAIDVVPFVPVRNSSINDCITLALKYGELISNEINVPVYLYEQAALKPERKNLSFIRKGEYEGLKEKITQPEWKPDFGLAEFNPKLGAIVTGARSFLIAYNVNIKSDDVRFAKEISEVLRESGKIIKDNYGNYIRTTGRLKSVKGLGVKLKSHNITQVSMNLTDYKVTPIHLAFEETKKEAGRLGVEVAGSEIIGLVPLEALKSAGEFYSSKNNLSETELIEIAIERLGLNSINPFKKEKKIIEYLIKK